MRCEAADAGVSRCEGLGTARREKLGGNDFKRDFKAATGRMTPLRRAPRLWSHAGAGFVEGKYLLAKAGRGNGRWDGGQLEMAQDAGNHRLLGDGGQDAQGATAAKRKVARLPPPTQWRKTGCHIHIKDATEQPCPIPIRGSRFRCIAVDTLLARGGNDCGPELAMRCQT